MKNTMKMLDLRLVAEHLYWRKYCDASLDMGFAWHLIQDPYDFHRDGRWRFYWWWCEALIKKWFWYLCYLPFSPWREPPDPNETPPFLKGTIPADEWIARTKAREWAQQRSKDGERL